MMLRRTFCHAPVLALAGVSAAVAADELLPPEQAFKMALGPTTASAVQIKFLSAPGYYLYADRFSFEVEGTEVRVVDVQMPPGATKYEAIFSRNVTYFRGLMVVTLNLSGPPVPFKLTVRAQGCADAGVCYPPVGRTFNVGRRNT